MSHVKKEYGPSWLLKPWEKIDSPIGIFYVRKNANEQITVLVQCILMPITMKRLSRFTLSDENFIDDDTDEFIPEPQFTWLLIEIPAKIKRKLHTIKNAREFDTIELAMEDADLRLTNLGFTLLTDRQSSFI